MLRLAFRWTVTLLLGVSLFSLLWVTSYRFFNPPTTFLMVRDNLQSVTVQQHWAPLSELPRHLPQAVIAAEDSRFCSHHGFDLDAIRTAMSTNAEGGRLRGASTISQQTAKNVFLWPGRTLLRKGMEAWFTLLAEWIWGKPRIMEVYLNVAEFGHGIFGVDAAARHYFGKSAQSLSRREAARLAAILPQPIKRSASSPGPYTRRYAGSIQARMRVVARDGLDNCLK